MIKLVSTYRTSLKKCPGDQLQLGESRPTYTFLMSALDQFWSFKLVLEERLGSRDKDQFEAREDHRPAIIAPFVEATKSQPMAGSSKDVERYYLTDDMVDQTVEVVAPSVEMPPEPPTKEAKPFTLPSAVELDRLSVRELRQLRRRLALEVHPDRIGSQAVAGQTDLMGHCNRLIDDAIGRKGS